MIDELPDISTLSRVPHIFIDMGDTNTKDESVIFVRKAIKDGVCMMSVRTDESGTVNVRHIEKKEMFHMTEDMFEDHIESEIKQKGLDAPRITRDHIDALMSKVQYTVVQFAVTDPTATTTLVLATLDGFHLATGFSACVSLENFDPEVGAKIASRDATNKAREKLWEMEGYVLARCLKVASAQPVIQDSLLESFGLK